MNTKNFSKKYLHFFQRSNMLQVVYEFFNSTQKAIQKRVVMQISKTNMLGNIMARSNIIDAHNKQQVDKKILGRIIQDVASDATQRPGGCHAQSHSRSVAAVAAAAIIKLIPILAANNK
jgi:hypothetical protein